MTVLSSFIPGISSGLAPTFSRGRVTNSRIKLSKIKTNPPDFQTTKNSIVGADTKLARQTCSLYCRDEIERQSEVPKLEEPNSF